MTDFAQTFRNSRNSASTESKLFQAVLSSCITDFQNFSVSTKPGVRRPAAIAATATDSSVTATAAVVDRPEGEGAELLPQQQQDDFTDAGASGADAAVETFSGSKPRAEEELEELRTPQHSKFTAAVASRSDVAVETFSSSKPRAEEELEQLHPHHLKSSSDPAAPTVRPQQDLTSALAPAPADSPTQSPSASLPVDLPKVNKMNRNIAQPRRGGLVGNSRWANQPNPRANENTNAAQNIRNGLGARSYGDQDAGSNANVAVQPGAAAPVKVALKKGAVKIAAAAPPARPAAPPAHPAAPLSTVFEKPDESSPSPAPSTPTSVPRMSSAEQKEAVNAIREKVRNVGGPSPKAAPKEDPETGLDAMFARLKAGTPSVVSTPRSVASKATGFSADKFVFETPSKGAKSDTASQKQEVDPKVVKESADPPSSAQFTFETPSKDIKKDTGMEKQSKWTDLASGTPGKETKNGNEAQKKAREAEYLEKAYEYLSALPSTENTPVYLVSTVARKLRQTIQPDGDIQDVDNLQSAVGDAVAIYLNGLARAGDRKIEPKEATQMLKENDGDFLKLCSNLIEDQLINVTLDDVVGLCNAIVKVLPQQQRKPALPVLPVLPVYKDPMDSIKDWPTPAKRENLAGCRTILIKGVGDLKNVHQLQALVWGGPVESIHMPDSGKDFAMIKFMTAAGCRKYFDTTENGIELATGNTKKTILVERQPGPNSVNDVLQNCIDGNVTRCVRAVGADEDWSDLVLRRLAEGTDKKKRQLDTIKRGKTARGHYYIEIRFSNIYDSLNFKRERTGDDEWEHCTISYAEDPCETANGFHIDD